MAEEFATHLTRRVFTNDDQKRITYTDENWFNALWLHRQKFIINNDHVFNESRNQILLINFGANASFVNNAQTDGDDFVVTQKDGETPIPHEIESYNSSTGALVMWIKIPQLSATSNAEVYIYYDNPAATNQEDPDNVWKNVYGIQSNDETIPFSYSAVYHLHADSLDSTENNNDGTDTIISYTTAGQIGNSANFDAVDSKISCGSDTSVDDVFNGVGGWLTCWINPNSDGEGSLGMIVQKSDGSTTGWRLCGHSESGGFMKLRFDQHFSSTHGIFDTTTAVVPIGSLSRIDVFYNDGDVLNVPTIFINKDITPITVTQTPIGTVQTDATELLVIGNNPGQTQTFDGEIDEVRLMKNAPDNLGDIIATEYHFEEHPTRHVTRAPHEEYKKGANLIAQDILDSANTDQPSGVIWTLSPDFPTDVITAGFSMRNHYQALDEIALILGKDLFFDNRVYQVFIETKGKTFGNNELLDLVVTSKPKKSTSVFANQINMLGKKIDTGIQLESDVSTSTVLRYNYEVVVSDNQLGTTGQVDSVANTLLTEMQKLTPAIKGVIPLVQFLRLQMVSGDIIKIAQPEKQLNGSFRIMEITATKKEVKIALEDISTGIIRQRSKSLSDTISTMLDKINDSGIESS